MQLCPLCKTPITQTLRYMNSVKKAYADILQVKLKIFGDQKTLKAKGKDLRNKLVLFVANSASNVKVTGLHEIHKMANEYSRKVDVGKRSECIISNTELNTIDFFYRMLVDIDSRLESLCEENYQRKTKELHDGTATKKVIDYVNSLLARMREPALHISKQQSEDFALELRRYHKMVDYSLVLRNASYLCRRNDETVNGMLEDIEYLILGIKRYDRVDEDLNKLFEVLKNELNTVVPLTLEEKRMINEAMSRDFFHGRDSTGHWYTCSNGHYYVITECGGAMVESNCPECGEVIGGKDHVSVPTARLATDMDGATHPACHGENERHFDYDGLSDSD